MRATLIHGNREEAEELIAHLSEKYPHVEFYKATLVP